MAESRVEHGKSNSGLSNERGETDRRLKVSHAVG